MTATAETKKRRSRAGRASSPARVAARDEIAAAGRSRARPADGTGTIERDGVRVAWARFGDGPRAILLLPTWSIVHSRFWKFQVPYLARYYRVLTFDGRGNGSSDRPTSAEAYADVEFAADALAVLDASGTREAVAVSLSGGAGPALLLAAEQPDRVRGSIFIAPSLPFAPPDPSIAPRTPPFDEEQAEYRGWAKYNRHYWRIDYPGFLEFFFGECLSEPHSTKPIEDCVEWGHETDGETLILTADAPEIGDRDRIMALARSIPNPVLVIHGSDDHVVGYRHGAALAELTRGRLLTFEGSGHLLNAREPVRTNLAIREFVESLRPSGG